MFYNAWQQEVVFHRNCILECMIPRLLFNLYNSAAGGRCSLSSLKQLQRRRKLQLSWNVSQNISRIHGKDTILAKNDNDLSLSSNLYNSAAAAQAAAVLEAHWEQQQQSAKAAAAAKLQLAYFVSLYLSTPISQPQCGRFGSEICGLRRTVYNSVAFNLPKPRDKNGLFLSKEHKGHLLLSPTIRSKLAEGFMKSWSYLLHNSRRAPPQRRQRIVKISTKKHCREPGAVYPPTHPNNLYASAFISTYCSWDELGAFYAPIYSNHLKTHTLYIFAMHINIYAMHIMHQCVAFIWRHTQYMQYASICIQIQKIHPLYWSGGRRL